MNIENVYEYCLAKKGVTEHFPFDKDTLVFKVADKMFALTSLQNWEAGNPSINLKCDPEKALELRAKFEGIVEGYHTSKKHWNTIFINKDVPDRLILELINDSYTLVWNSLPKKIRENW